MFEFARTRSGAKVAVPKGAKPLLISLDTPGRLYSGHWLPLLGGISARTFHRKRKLGPDSLPAPDGFDGRRPFWTTATVKAFLCGAASRSRTDAMAASEASAPRGR
jgi:hypothetical protein